jgi:hypothetical protein
MTRIRASVSYARHHTEPHRSLRSGRHRCPQIEPSPTHLTAARRALFGVLRTAGNPDHGGADSSEVVFLCIASARRELPLLPHRARAWAREIPPPRPRCSLANIDGRLVHHDLRTSRAAPAMTRGASRCVMKRPGRTRADRRSGRLTGAHCHPGSPIITIISGMPGRPRSGAGAAGPRLGVRPGRGSVTLCVPVAAVLRASGRRPGPAAAGSAAARRWSGLRRRRGRRRQRRAGR